MSTELEEPLAKALTSRILINGVPRQYFVANIIINGSLAFGGRIYFWPAIAFCSIHFLLASVTAIDEWLFEILQTHFQQADYYDA
jgi:type IV secretory pathway TrbD component